MEPREDPFSETKQQPQVQETNSQGHRCMWVGQKTWSLGEAGGSMVTAEGMFSIRAASWCRHEIIRWFTLWSLFCRWRNRGTEKLSDFAAVTGWGGPGLEFRENLTLGLCPAHGVTLPPFLGEKTSCKVTPPRPRPTGREGSMGRPCSDVWSRALSANCILP